MHAARLILIRRQGRSTTITTVLNVHRCVPLRRVVLFATILDVDIVPRSFADVDLTRTPDLDTAGLEHHLTPVCEPAYHSRNGEKDREDCAWRKVEKQRIREKVTRSAANNTERNAQSMGKPISR